MEAGQAHDIAEIERDADKTQGQKIDDANRAGNHDRRVGRTDLLVGHGKGRWRQATTALDRRSADVHGRRGGIKQ